MKYSKIPPCATLIIGDLHKITGDLHRITEALMGLRMVIKDVIMQALPLALVNGEIIDKILVLLFFPAKILPLKIGYCPGYIIKNGTLCVSSSKLLKPTFIY